MQRVQEARGKEAKGEAGREGQGLDWQLLEDAEALRCSAASQTGVEQCLPIQSNPTVFGIPAMPSSVLGAQSGTWAAAQKR